MKKHANNRWAKILEWERSPRLQFKSTGQGDLYGTPTYLSIREIAQSVGLGSGNVAVIDLGSGTGNFLFVLEEIIQTRLLVGIEFRQDWFDESMIRAAELKSCVHLHYGDIMNIQSFTDLLGEAAGVIDCLFVFAFDARFPDCVKAKVKELYTKWNDSIVLISCWAPHYYHLSGEQLSARIRIGVLGPEGVELEPGYTRSVSYLEENYTAAENEAREEQELADYKSGKSLLGTADPDKQIEEFLLWKYKK